jgi:signal transduction histidine kinase/ligand-binding sensor domain-containing protein
LIIGLYLYFFVENGIAQPKILSDIRKIHPSETYLVSSWTSNHGLPQNTINTIAQDSKGFIWLSTFGGLVRFDGVNFKVFTSKEYPVLLSDRIVNIFIDKNDLIFIANESGQVLTFNGKKFSDITSKFPRSNINYAFLGEDSKGNKYILADSLVYYYAKEKIELIDFSKIGYSAKVNKHLSSSSEMSGDSLLIFKDQMALLLYNGKIVKSIKAHLKGEITNSCVVNSMGYWWLTSGKLMFSKRFENINNATKLFEDKKFISIYGKGDKIIASTWERELVSIDNFKISTIQEKNRKIISLYSQLFIDKKNNYWIGSEIDGLFYVRKKFLYTLDKSFGINRLNTYPIFKASDNSIWIGQNYGLQRIINNKIEDFALEKTINLAPWGIAEDKDKNIWLATTGNGIFKYNGKQRISYKDKISHQAGDKFFSAFSDKDNNIWFGGIGNIVRYKNHQFEFFRPYKNKANLFRNFIQDKEGTIWIASEEGLMKYENNNFIPIKDFKLNSARALYIDKKNRIWIGTYGKGIAVKNGDDFHYLSEREGLFSNIVSAIVEDGIGNFWFTSNNGLFRIRESEIESYLSGKGNEVISIHYGIDDGLSNIEFNGGCQPSWMRDDDGNLWFPSFGGPVIVDLKSLSDPITEPKAFIENLVVEDLVFSPEDKIKIPADYTNFTINFNSPSFSSPKNVKYRYRLLGSSDKWHDNNNVGQITFQKLPYGDYEFQLLVIDSHGNKSKKPVSIKFTIQSVFYETPLFYILCSLLIIVIISILYYVRIRLSKIHEMKLEALVNERTISLKIAKENAEHAVEEEKIHRAKAEEENRQKIELLRIVSHDLKNPVFAIKGLIEMLLDEGSLDEEDKKIVRMIGESGDRQAQLISELLNYSRYEGSDFNLDKTEINVVSSIKRILTNFYQTAHNKNQEIQFESPKDIIIIEADTILFTQIIENLLSNAIKFSPMNKNIFISVQSDNGKVQIKIKDEGLGFSEEDKLIMFKPFVKLSSIPTNGEASTGLGLSIVKRFVELNNGTISLNSIKDNGAEFILEFDEIKED